MAAIALPNTLADISANWLTEVLRSTETIQKSRVTSCRAETIGAGTGLIADLAKLHIPYDSPEKGAPKRSLPNFRLRHLRILWWP